MESDLILLPPLQPELCLHVGIPLTLAWLIRNRYQTESLVYACGVVREFAGCRLQVLGNHLVLYPGNYYLDRVLGFARVPEQIKGLGEVIGQQWGPN